LDAPAKKATIQNLRAIPGVGVSIAGDLYNIGIRRVEELRGKNPEDLYRQSNAYAGVVQDICLLYVFRCAVYFATEQQPEPGKLKWWYWKEHKL
jgi:pathogenicity locus Cdd1 protein